MTGARSADPKKLRSMKCLVTSLSGALALAAAAVDPIAHYPFEAVDLGATPEAVSAGADAAVFGPAGSLARNSRRLGTGALRLRPALADPAVPDGDDGAVSSNTLDWSAGDTRTIAFWMRTGAVADSLPTMISLGAGTTNGARFDIRLQTGPGTTAVTPPGPDGLLRLEVQGGFVECTAADFTDAGLGFTSLRDGNWHHIAVVVPHATSTVHDALFYIDGVPVSHTTQGANQAINTATGPLRIGDSYQDYSRDFSGYLDDVRVYNLALTAQEVLGLFNDGVTNASAIAAFEADPELLASGAETRFTWQVTGATAVSLDRGVGDVTGLTTVPAVVTGEGTVTYTLSVTTAGGTETAPLDLTVLGLVRLTAPVLTPDGFSCTAVNLVPGRSYQPEYAFDLAEEGWSLLGGVIVGPASTTAVILDPAADPALDPKVFYRLREVVAE